MPHDLMNRFEKMSRKVAMVKRQHSTPDQNDENGLMPAPSTSVTDEVTAGGSAQSEDPEA